MKTRSTPSSILCWSSGRKWRGRNASAGLRRHAVSLSGGSGYVTLSTRLWRQGSFEVPPAQRFWLNVIAASSQGKARAQPWRSAAAALPDRLPSSISSARPPRRSATVTTAPETGATAVASSRILLRHTSSGDQHGEGDGHRPIRRRHRVHRPVWAVRTGSAMTEPSRPAQVLSIPVWAAVRTRIAGHRLRHRPGPLGATTLPTARRRRRRRSGGCGLNGAQTGLAQELLQSDPAPVRLTAQLLEVRRCEAHGHEFGELPVLAQGHSFGHRSRAALGSSR